jgi:hypothetical protein
MWNYLNVKVVTLYSKDKKKDLLNIKNRLLKQ